MPSPLPTLTDVAIDSIRAETLLDALLKLNRRYACVMPFPGCISQGEQLFGTRRHATVADGARIDTGPRVNPIPSGRIRP